MMLGAYTISQKPVVWNIRCPHVNLVNELSIDKYRRTDEYLAYLTGKRNRAVTELLGKYPKTTHVLCCDSYYVQQTRPLQRLIEDYDRREYPMVLGGAIYGPWRQRLRDVLWPRTTFSDPWGVPSLAWTKPDGHGLVEADGVSGVHIFPVWSWNDGLRYGNFPDRNTGTETTFLARQSGLAIRIDMDAMFYRDRRFSRVKCIRISLGVRTRLKRILK